MHYICKFLISYNARVIIRSYFFTIFYLFLLIIANWKNYDLFLYCLSMSIVIFYYSLYLFLSFNKTYFFINLLKSIILNILSFFSNFEYRIGVDSVSLCFIFLLLLQAFSVMYIFILLIVYLVIYIIIRNNLLFELL